MAKNIIKILCLLLIIAVVAVICVFVMNSNESAIEEQSVPVIINPVKEQSQQIIPAQKISPQKPAEKPITRDENNMPKSDYKVPEIG